MEDNDRSSVPLGSKAKEIVHNVSQHFHNDSEKSYVSKTATATGVSRATVLRIRREKRDTGKLLSPTRKKRGAYKPLDDFDKSVIRNKITEFYTVRKQLPTLKALHSILIEEIDFPGSITTLGKIMKGLGYKWKKTKDNRKVLIERPNVVALRLEFYRRRKELKERGLQFVYIDETWVDTAYTVKRCWQGPETPGVIPPCNRGQRIIVVHAGSRNGFIPRALLVYKAKARTGDYHSEMDGNNFIKWLEEMLIPNLDEPCAIVMDNASYHSMRKDKCPTSSTRKAEIQEWLLKQGISFEETMLRPQLLQLVQMNKPPPSYTVDELLQSHGHEVLRLPPYHPDFNAIELIWSQMKGIVRKNNLTFRYNDVLQITKEAFEQISSDKWISVCQHVDRHIEKCKKDDIIVDKQIDGLVINLKDDTSTDTESSDDL